jgi:hypothetical protein
MSVGSQAAVFLEPVVNGVHRIIVPRAALMPPTAKPRRTYATTAGKSS